MRSAIRAVLIWIYYWVSSVCFDMAYYRLTCREAFASYNDDGDGDCCFDANAAAVACSAFYIDIVDYIGIVRSLLKKTEVSM